MDTFIILLLVAIATFIGAKKAEDCSGWEISCVILTGLLTLTLIAHTVSISLVTYNFNKFVVQRNAFIESLTESRKNGNILESATILKDISDFNQKLASDKYDNKTWLLGQYIDDKIETLEPIK